MLKGEQHGNEEETGQEKEKGVLTMGMKPRMNDSAKAIPGVVNNPSPVAELSDAVPGTVTDSKVEVCHPIPGTVAQGYSTTETETKE